MRRRYVQIDGKLVEVGSDYVQIRSAVGSHNILHDIKPYRSMIDGSEITSRSKHRAHLRAHGCVEIGNERIPERKLTPPPGLKETIIRAVNEKLR